MNKSRPRRLRWRLAVPLTVAFFLLWLGTMVVLTNSACDRLEGTVSQEYEYAQKALEEQWEIYQNNRDNDLGAQADHILMYNLSAASGGLTDIGEGGMAFLVRNSLGQEVRSQLAYGYGHEAGWTRDSGGTGLGLAIVRTAVSAHGGSCGVEQRAEGPCFWLCLPVGQDEGTVS